MKDVTTIRVRLKGHGQEWEETHPISPWPRGTSSLFLMWLEINLSSNPAFLLVGHTQSFEIGNVHYDVEVLEIDGPLFSPNREYFGHDGSWVMILFRNKESASGSPLYMLKCRDGLKFNIDETAVLNFLLTGAPMESTLDCY